jgi:hypothetical protein
MQSLALQYQKRVLHRDRDREIRIMTQTMTQTSLAEIPLYFDVTVPGDEAEKKNHWT